MKTHPISYKTLLFISISIVLLAACSQTVSANPTASPTPQPTVNSTTTTATIPIGKTIIPPSSTPLILIAMWNKIDGWALTKNAVLKTTDGGTFWQTKTTLPALSPGYGGPAAAFLGDNYAWVTFHAASSPANVFTLLRTIDGGTSWQTVTIHNSNNDHFMGISRPHFINPQEGWVMTSAEMGMYKSIASLFHTTDGGQHWNLVADTGTLATSPHNLPLPGDMTDFSFQDSQRGWITFDLPSPYPTLYMTSDGGHTWQTQKLPFPSAISNAEQVGEAFTTPPVFFGNEGLLPAFLYYQSQSHMVLYVTHNGGATWIPTTPLLINGHNIYVTDMQHAWASDQSGLYTTSDGGQHWTNLGQLPLTINQMSFINHANLVYIGWAIGTHQDQSPALYHTEDGGKTWQQINYYIK